MNKESSVYKMLVLGILCAVCGLLLSFVNKVTAPIIEQNQLAVVKAELEKIYPGADFKDVTDDYIGQDETGLIDGIYVAEGKGYVFTLHGTGYNSNGFTFLAGFDNDGSISGFAAIEENETSGIGKRCFDDGYISQLTALTSADPIPLLSGATLTSTAIQKGLDAAKAVFNAVNGIEYDPNAVAANPTLGEIDFSDKNASCTDNGDGTYACYADGYLAMSDNGEPNEALITIKDGKIVSIEMVAVNDSPGISDSAVSADALAAYAGADLDTDIVTGATASFTEASIKAMAQAALKMAAGQ